MASLAFQLWDWSFGGAARSFNLAFHFIARVSVVARARFHLAAEPHSY